MLMTVTPRDIHALWILAKSAPVISRNQFEDVGRRVFELALPEEIGELVELGVSLDIYAKANETWSLTRRGRYFSKLPHWRIWAPLAGAKDVLGQERLRHWFINRKKLDERPLIIDLFAGAGGLTYGFSKAGFQVKVALDNDAESCAAHKRNFPDSIVLKANIEEVIDNPKKKLCIDYNIDPRRIAGIIGGPPCQGFSFIGERQVNDERNLLTSRFMDIVLDIEPQFFLMENVSGLLSSGRKPDFSTYIRQLAKPIGQPAAVLANGLPQAPRILAKRDWQYRKRMISNVIIEFKRHLRNENSFDNVGKLSNGIQKLVSKEHKSFLTSLELAIRAIYRKDSGKTWPLSLASFRDKAAVISICTVLEAGLDAGMSDSELGRALASLRNSKNRDVKIAARSIIDEYKRAPVSADYKGIEVGPVLLHLIEKASSKYDVAAPRVINSALFGAPQDRKRLFLAGIHKSLGKKFQFPSPNYSLPNRISADLLKMPEAPTCGQAIADLPDADEFTQLVSGDRIPARYQKPEASEFAKEMRLEVINELDFSLPPLEWNPFVITNCMRTMHDSSVIDRLKCVIPGKVDETSHRRRLEEGGVSHTLRAGTREGKGSHTAVRPVHYEFNRVITVREGARLMGYPDWMSFHQTKWHGFRLVGNGVPSPLGYAIARRLAEFLK